eukprot:1771346-Pyramimonas_sp.AAC.1
MAAKMATLALRAGAHEAPLNSHTARSLRLGRRLTTPRPCSRFTRNKAVTLLASSSPAFEAWNDRFQLPADLRKMLGGDLHEIYNLDFDEEDFDEDDAEGCALPTYW